MVLNNKLEMRFARLSLVATSALFLALYYCLILRAHTAYSEGNLRLVAEIFAFGTALFFIAYSNLVYPLCLIGHYKRKISHRSTPQQVLEEMYDGNAPTLSILVPSYKEERNIIWQTLMSAALAEYPQKNIVLLIDDPYRPRALEDIVKLEETRLIPGEMQQMFSEAAALHQSELDAFRKRKSEGSIFWGFELNRLSMRYDEVAEWLETRTLEFMAGRTYEELPYAERFFVDSILLTPMQQHRDWAEALRQKLDTEHTVDTVFLERQYTRLVSLFNVSFSSFERKKYQNLSHEANKAMNLNSYMSLIGRSWKEVERAGGQMELLETTPDLADFSIPHCDYVNTIDADSLMLNDYVIRLIHLMEQPGNERLAVAQSPCSSFAGCPGGVERAAAACIDVLFNTHQGFTHWDASFWVGANAMIRRTALEDCKEVNDDLRCLTSIYVQDQTVIEDTESTIHFVSKGWKLYNYPKRMTFSATPPDFGSLLIQRRRWSNGGLLIVPKLLRYFAGAPKSLSLFKECSLRLHNLASTTTCCLAPLLLLTYPFGDLISLPLLPLTMLPMLLLMMRDLKNAGYKYTDIFGVCALNLMLFPVITGGVFKQFQQMVTGRKIPFSRTPKITGRTSAPALYCMLEIAFTAAFAGYGVREAMLGNVFASLFMLANAALLTYALVRFIGIAAIVEDMSASLRKTWRTAFHHAEIIRLPVGSWLPQPGAASRRQA